MGPWVLLGSQEGEAQMGLQEGEAQMLAPVKAVAGKSPAVVAGEHPAAAVVSRVAATVVAGSAAEGAAEAYPWWPRPRPRRT